MSVGVFLAVLGAAFLHAAWNSIIRATDLDWYDVRGGHALAEQAAVTINEEADGVYQRDARTGSAGSWSRR